MKKIEFYYVAAWLATALVYFFYDDADLAILTAISWILIKKASPND